MFGQLVHYVLRHARYPMMLLMLLLLMVLLLMRKAVEHLCVPFSLAVYQQPLLQSKRQPQPQPLVLPPYSPVLSMLPLLQQLMMMMMMIPSKPQHAKMSR